MPPVDEKLDETTKTVTFAETPVMSTYILAFVVGDFEYLEEKTKEGIIMRVYTPLGKKDKGKFALDIGGNKQPNIHQITIFLQLRFFLISLITSTFPIL